MRAGAYHINVQFHNRRNLIMNTIPLLSKIRAIRNIGMFAHIDAGKTTTSEAILYHVGKIRRAGKIDDGNTQLDWMEQERERGITITSAATTCYWNDYRINLIDTPGHVDFSSEVLRSIRVIDGAVIVLCGVGGVESQTETIWNYAERESVPHIIYVNKLDRPTADFAGVLEDICTKLTKSAVALSVPVGSEGRFFGSLDVLSGEPERGYLGDVAEGATAREVKAAKAEANRRRDSLVEFLSTLNEDIFQTCLSGRDPSPRQIKAAIRQATIRRELVPVFCGSSLKNLGISTLLDAVIEFLLSPDESRIEGRPLSKNPAGGQKISNVAFRVFKTVVDRHLGRLGWCRVFAGEISSGQKVSNLRTGKEERIGGVYLMHANKRERVESAAAGNVVAVGGLRSASTGDMYSDVHILPSAQPFDFPKPIISVALSPEKGLNSEKLSTAIAQICSEDPTLTSRVEDKTGKLLLSGMGELHLDIAVDRLRSEYGVRAIAGNPQIAYRATVGKKAEGIGEYRKQSGGHGHFAVVKVRVEPAKPGSGIAFEVESGALAYEGSAAAKNRAKRNGIFHTYVKSIEAGIREAAALGTHSKFPLSDMRIVLLGGQYHTYDSTGRDFHIAASLALKSAMQQAKPVVLEPVMKIELRIDDQCLGRVLADLSKRRGKIRSINPNDGMSIVGGETPFAEMHDYATVLRDMTEGRGTFSLEFLYYKPCLKRQVKDQLIGCG